MTRFSGCVCFGKADKDVYVLDYRHCSLDFLPSDVFTAERTLEELFLDANQIRDLPRELFYCHSLRKFTISDNDVISIPPAIASLTNLQHLDFSKNGVIDLPENIKQCKNLAVVEASVNPLGKLPEGFTQLLNLSELYLNDTFLDYLPGSFGRLTQLKILEVRENHLKTLPKSLARLTQLQRLDIGQNDFTELPDVVGALHGLLELWCDTNQLQTLTPCIGDLKQLMFLDASKNRLLEIPPDIQGCEALADLHLSINLLETLPESLGRLSNLTSLKLDDNRLTCLPFSIGGLVSLSELNISANDLEELPPSLGLLRLLRTFYADENLISEIPPELGSCSGLSVLSLRSNNLSYIPDEMGRLPRLRVLNLSDNRLSFLPYSLTRLKELQALWLAENQTKPLVRLQSEVEPITGQRVLTCYLLPQQPQRPHDDEMYSDTDSFHPSMWEEEREQRQQIKFDFAGLDDQGMSRLKRTPTPYPKEMKQRIQHMRNLALKQSGYLGNNAERIQRTDEAYQRVSGRVNQSSEGPVHSEQWAGRDRASTSPLLAERHVLYRADKERQERDKARMRERQARKMSGASSQSSIRSGAPRSPIAADGNISDEDGGFVDQPGNHGRSRSLSGNDRHSPHTPRLKAPVGTGDNQFNSSGGGEPQERNEQRNIHNASHNAPAQPGEQSNLDGRQQTSGGLETERSVNTHEPRNAGMGTVGSHSDGADVLSADSRYPSHLQPAYQPLPHLMALPQQSGRSSRRAPATQPSADVPRTYGDFLRDLQAKSEKQRAWRGDGAAGRASLHATGRQQTGYESDIGYRNEGLVAYGDISTGYRSDTGAHYPHSVIGVPRGASGYNSDWGGHDTRGYVSDWGSGGGQPGGRGYASDWERGSQAKNKRIGAGYTSDHEAYARRRSNHNHANMAPGKAAPLLLNNNNTTDPNRSSGGNHHTHLRSDEMYEHSQQNNNRPHSGFSHGNHDSYNSNTTHMQHSYGLHMQAKNSQYSDAPYTGSANTKQGDIRGHSSGVNSGRSGRSSGGRGTANRNNTAASHGQYSPGESSVRKCDAQFPTSNSSQHSGTPQSQRHLSTNAPVNPYARNDPSSAPNNLTTAANNIAHSLNSEPTLRSSTNNNRTPLKESQTSHNNASMRSDTSSTNNPSTPVLRKDGRGRGQVEEREGWSDDDGYRAQLYAASVLLQKSPRSSAASETPVAKRSSNAQRNVFSSPMTSYASPSTNQNHPTASTQVSHNVAHNNHLTKTTNDVQSTSKSNAVHCHPSSVKATGQNQINSPLQESVPNGMMMASKTKSDYETSSLSEVPLRSFTPLKTERGLVSKSLNFNSPPRISRDPKVRSQTLDDLNTSLGQCGSPSSKGPLFMNPIKNATYKNTPLLATHKQARDVNTAPSNARDHQTPAGNEKECSTGLNSFVVEPRPVEYKPERLRNKSFTDVAETPNRNSTNKHDQRTSLNLSLGASPYRTEKKSQSVAIKTGVASMESMNKTTSKATSNQDYSSPQKYARTNHGVPQHEQIYKSMQLGENRAGQYTRSSNFGVYSGVNNVLTPGKEHTSCVYTAMNHGVSPYKDISHDLNRSANPGIYEEAVAVYKSDRSGMDPTKSVSVDRGYSHGQVLSQSSLNSPGPTPIRHEHNTCTSGSIIPNPGHSRSVQSQQAGLGTTSTGPVLSTLHQSHSIMNETKPGSNRHGPSVPV